MHGFAIFSSPALKLSDENESISSTRLLFDNAAASRRYESSNHLADLLRGPNLHLILFLAPRDRPPQQSLIIEERKLMEKRERKRLLSRRVTLRYTCCPGTPYTLLFLAPTHLRIAAPSSPVSRGYWWI